METYLRSCRGVLQSHMKNSSGLLHVVLGNEACDIDSMISALTFAYFLSKTLESGKAAVPILNIPRAEFPLRSDNVFLLRETGLSQDYLLFRDEVDLHGLQQLAITLVDHNVLPEADHALEKAVVEVIDHHRLDRAPSPSCSVTVETVGSCATLVTEHIVQKAPEVLDQQVAQLLYGTIITDCVNMAPEAGKVTPKDSQYAILLETQFPKLPPRSILFQSLQNAKFDVSGLTTEQMMLKDMKTVSGGDLRLAVSVIYMTLESFLQRPRLQQELCEFCHKHSYNLVVAMTISFINDKEPFRQLAVYSSCTLYRDEVSKALEKARNPNLDLRPMSSPYPDVKAYVQGNTLASRKKVLPIILDFLKDRERKMAQSGNLEDLELEDECTQDPSDSQQCCEDSAIEEDSGVPPTPMNSLVEGCPLDNGLPKINAEVLVEKVSKIASEEDRPFEGQ
ncbi:exopolyphosphatase PRUNE1 [Pygocentrus nattereri]|uniref:DHHA2 domain-containing protein n=1 Tax=Pygocentrus nattereri TaxID=42514 RepID=A0A3B4D6P9_PYGNA|nr:exopolyphosphatase PRUNE1 [Pygocentrus nattereri]